MLTLSSILVLPAVHAAYCHDATLCISITLIHAFCIGNELFTGSIFRYGARIVSYYVWVLILLRTLLMPISPYNFCLFSVQIYGMVSHIMYQPWSYLFQLWIVLLSSMVIHAHTYLYWMKLHIVQYSFPPVGMMIGPNRLCFDLSESVYE